MIEVKRRVRTWIDFKVRGCFHHAASLLWSQALLQSVGGGVEEGLGVDGPSMIIVVLYDSVALVERSPALRRMIANLENWVEYVGACLRSNKQCKKCEMIWNSRNSLSGARGEISEADFELHRVQRNLAEVGIKSRLRPNMQIYNFRQRNVRIPRTLDTK